MFGKKQKPVVTVTQESCPLPQPPANVGDVYVMPDKFHLKGKSGGSSLSLTVIILVALLAIIAAVMAYAYFNRPAQTVSPDAAGSTALDFGTGNEQMPQEAAATTTDATSTDALSTSTASSTDNLSSEASTTQATTSPVSLVAAQVSADADNDGLTDIEESIVGSSPTSADSDGDGFKDGDELATGYNPLVPNSSDDAKLSAADFIKQATTEFDSDNFSIYLPQQWSFTSVKAAKQAVITTATGEIIKVSVRDNPARQSALDWYLAANPQVPAVQVRQVEYGDLSGLFSPDGLSAYLSDPQRTRVYAFEYIMDAGGQFRYPNFFRLMVKNFRLVSSD